MEGTFISIYKNWVTVELWVNKDLSLREGNFGGVRVSDGRIDKKDVYWDNIDYFLKLKKKKIKELKKDLQEANQLYDTWVQDVEWCINRFKKLGYLKKKKGD
jgi:hypothetical protein